MSGSFWIGMIKLFRIGEIETFTDMQNKHHSGSVLSRPFQISEIRIRNRKQSGLARKNFFGFGQRHFRIDDVGRLWIEIIRLFRIGEIRIFTDLQNKHPSGLTLSRPFKLAMKGHFRMSKNGNLRIG